jgi:predicted Zn-dependent protease
MTPEAFFALAADLGAGLRGGEVLFCGLDGEDSDFVRLNGGRIRQAGSVHRRTLGLTLIDAGRQVEGGIELGGGPAADRALAGELLARLRERLAHVPVDPYLHFSRESSTGQREVGADLPPAEAVVAALIEAAAGLDLVGIWASGTIHAGLASSLGHRHWHSATSFHLDWSAYLQGDKAVKASWGGLRWESERLAEQVAAVRARLAVMARAPRTPKPGRYRAYLAPAAVEELMGMLAWDGFDLKSHRTAQTPLLRLVRGERTLSPAVTLVEEHGRGLVPGFTGEGFLLPEAVPLIEAGRFAECLVDARDGCEYGVPVNAAGGAPESLALAAGEIPDAAACERLGDGLYIGNLWYCNWSDRNDCRITGMTRFASFWVERGEIVAPLSVMRFDDSLYHLLGDRLEGLTQGRELILSADTYGGRSTASARLPGILVEGIELAL